MATFNYTGSIIASTGFTGSLQGVASANLLTASFNAYTGSVTPTSSFNTFTASAVVTSSFNAFTASAVVTSSFNAFTASAVTTSSFNSFTASAATTASLNSFTASVNTFTASVATTASLNSFTASISSWTGSAYTGSVDQFATTASLNTFTASVSNTTSSLNNFTGSAATTASLNAYTASTDASLLSLSTFTGSLNVWTSSVTPTASFNTFTGSVYAIDSASFSASIKTLNNWTGSSASNFAGQAASASYISLEAGPGISINRALDSTLSVTASVQSVNGVTPVNGNVSIALTSTFTGTSASLSDALTGSYSTGSIWVISGDPTPALNGETFILVSSSFGSSPATQWEQLSGFDVAAADARYLKLDGGNGPMAGNVNWGGYKITNILDGSAMSDVAAYGQILAATASLRNDLNTGITGSVNTLSAGVSASLNASSSALTASLTLDLNNAVSSLQSGVSASINASSSALQAGVTSSINTAVASLQAGVTASVAGFATTSSLNTFTASYLVDSSSLSTRVTNTETSITNLNSFTGSVYTGSQEALVTTASLNEFTASYKVDSASFESSITSLVNWTGSAYTGSVAGFATTTSIDIINNWTSSAYTGSVEGFATTSSVNLINDWTGSSTSFFAGTASYISASALVNRIIAGTNVTITPGPDSLTIAAAGGGSSTDVSTYLSSSWTGSNASVFSGTASYVATASYVPTLQQITTRGNQTTTSIIFGTGSASYPTVASGLYSFAQGEQNRALGDSSHAEGFRTTAVGNGAHSQGFVGIAVGNYSHAEGNLTTAISNYTHTEGSQTTALAVYSHAEGQQTITFGESSHAEGFSTTTVGNRSHAEGELTTAKGIASHAEGQGTITSATYQHAEGKWNIEDTTALWVVGDGTSDASRSNLIAAYTNKVTITGSLQITQGGVTGSFSGSGIISSASYAVTASHISVTGSGVGVNWNGSTLQLTASAGGGAAFPYTGSAQITGSLVVTGSIRSSYVFIDGTGLSTVDIDPDISNYFEIAYADNTPVAINITKYKPGQTIALLLDNSNGVIWDFSTSTAVIKFPNGYNFTTPGGSHPSVISLLGMGGFWYAVASDQFIPATP